MSAAYKIRLRLALLTYHPRTANGFSLVEVTVALGILAFAFTSIFGLLPIGLSTARKAVETSVGSQIVQRVVGDCRQTDFGLLTSGTMSFDDQANLLSSPSDPKKIYDVQVLLHSALLPGATAANTNLARVQITVVSNPGGAANPFAGAFPSRTYSAYVARSSSGYATIPSMQ